MKTSIGAIAAACVAAAAPALAAPSSRTFVATYGNDGSPTCAISAPCRTFGAAITQTAVGGEVVVLDSGGYGRVDITQSVSLIAPSGVYAGISVFAGPAGIVVNGFGIVVTLRGLAVNGQGGDKGIEFTDGAHLTIERCTVAKITGAGILNGSTGALAVLDSVLEANAGAGVRATRGTTTIERSQLVHNNTGAFLTSGGASDSGSLAVVDSFVIGNVSKGVATTSASNQSYRILVARSTIHDNGHGIVVSATQLGSQASGSISDSLIDFNGDGVRVEVVPDGAASAHVSNNKIVLNSLHGALATGPGASILAGANRMDANATAGLRGASGGTVYTRGNNEIYGISPLMGTVVPADPDLH